MHFEATGELPEAEALYAKELEKNPTNATFLKRASAIKTGAGDLLGGVGALQAFLDAHLVDWAAWEEAAAGYLRLGALPQAIFCLEEVLLHQPGNLSAQTLLADTLYAAGGAANWQAARGYYSGLVEATGGTSARALYGICACAAQLEDLSSKAGVSSGEGEVARLAAEALVQAYATEGGRSDKLAGVKEALKGQGLG